VHGIAEDVQHEVPAEQRCAQVGARGREARHHQEAKAGAQREDLHHAQRPGEDAHRDRHRRERQQRTGHP
jgi:hypothetical protein